jgi:hypothetical protein
MRKLLAALLVSTLLPGTAFAQQFCVPGNGPPGQITPVMDSQIGTAAALTATLTGAAGKFTYVCGYLVQTAGAGTAAAQDVQITGTLVTMHNAYLDPSSGQGVTGVAFPTCFRSAAVNTNIVITKPNNASGGGAEISSLTLWGCLQ